jgi:hypothetical protein
LPKKKRQGRKPRGLLRPKRLRLEYALKQQPKKRNVSAGPKQRNRHGAPAAREKELEAAEQERRAAENERRYVAEEKGREATSSASRFTVGATGFLTLTYCFERPER